MKSIRDIKEEFQNAADLAEKERIAQSYSEDNRKGVQDLIVRVKKEKEKLAAEITRLQEMKFFERKYADCWQSVESMRREEDRLPDRLLQVP